MFSKVTHPDPARLIWDRSYNSRFTEATQQKMEQRKRKLEIRGSRYPPPRPKVGIWGVGGWRQALSIHKCSNAPGHTEVGIEALATFMSQD